MEALTESPSASVLERSSWYCKAMSSLKCTKVSSSYCTVVSSNQFMEASSQYCKACVPSCVLHCRPLSPSSYHPLPPSQQHTPPSAASTKHCLPHHTTFTAGTTHLLHWRLQQLDLFSCMTRTLTIFSVNYELQTICCSYTLWSAPPFALIISASSLTSQELSQACSVWPSVWQHLSQAKFINFNINPHGLSHIICNSTDNGQCPSRVLSLLIKMPVGCAARFLGICCVAKFDWCCDGSSEDGNEWGELISGTCKVVQQVQS